jgi:hypothetical protein
MTDPWLGRRAKGRGIGRRSASALEAGTRLSAAEATFRQLGLGEVAHQAHLRFRGGL